MAMRAAAAILIAMGLGVVEGLQFNPFSMSKNKRAGKLWEPVGGTAPPPRSGSCAAVDQNGRTWVFGGYAEEADGSRAVVNDVWVYDGPGAEGGEGGWSLAQPHADDYKRGLLIDYSTRPRSRLVSAAVVAEHELLVIGGS